MIGWLIKEKQVGFLQQQLGQGNAHLPAAGELFRPAVPVFFPEAQAVEHRADFSLYSVSVAGLHLTLYAMESLGNLLVLRACVVNLSHAPRQVFLFALHLVYLLKNRKAFGKDRASGKRKAILRQVPRLNAALLRDRTVIERF